MPEFPAPLSGLHGGYRPFAHDPANEGQKSLLPEVLVASFFLLTPFTWSFLDRIGGFLLRPIDLVGLGLLVLAVVYDRVSIPQRARMAIMIFAGLVCWILINGFLTDELRAPVTAAKIGLYLVISIVVSSFIVRSGFVVSEKIVLWLVLAFAIYVLVARQELLFIIYDFGALVASNPARAIFNFWNQIFQFNLFGPQQVLEVVGGSYRNTAALGFLSIALFAYGLMRKSTVRTLLLYSSIFLVIFSLSRTGLIAAALFIALIVFSAQNLRSGIVAVGLVIVVATISLNAVVFETIEERFNRDLGGREDMNVAGLIKIAEAPLFGHGAEAKVSHTIADRTVHNVPIALGAEYGFPAFALAGSIIIFNLFSFFYFLGRWFYEQNDTAKRLYACFATAAFVISTRPNLSASSENFYSLSEWACFALVMAGYAASRYFQEPAHIRLAELPAGNAGIPKGS